MNAMLRLAVVLAMLVAWRIVGADVIKPGHVKVVVPGGFYVMSIDGLNESAGKFRDAAKELLGPAPDPKDVADKLHALVDKLANAQNKDESARLVLEIRTLCDTLKKDYRAETAAKAKHSWINYHSPIYHAPTAWAVLTPEAKTAVLETDKLWKESAIIPAKAMPEAPVRDPRLRK
jgi:hypothetical protein